MATDDKDRWPPFDDLDVGDKLRVHIQKKNNNVFIEKVGYFSWFAKDRGVYSIILTDSRHPTKPGIRLKTRLIESLERLKRAD